MPLVRAQEEHVYVAVCNDPRLIGGVYCLLEINFRC